MRAQFLRGHDGDQVRRLRVQLTLKHLDRQQREVVWLAGERQQLAGHRIDERLTR